jgi:cell division protein FtsQ
MSRRRRKRSPIARLRPFWILIVLVVAVVAGALGFAFTDPAFDATQVSVSGTRRVSRDEILARARVWSHASIWLQNTAAIARRVEAIPYVAVARVSRIPPSTIDIVVAERSPFAVLSSGTETALVDRTLRVLELGSGDGTLPVLVVEPGLSLNPGDFVHAPSATELVGYYQVMEAHHLTPTQLGFDPFGGLVVTLPSGLRLLIGQQSDLAMKLTLADAILAQVAVNRRHVAAIDLRAPSAPVLVYR